MKHKPELIKFFFPTFYAAVFLLVVLNAIDIQTDIKQDSGPLYKNLREVPAYVKRGFDRTTPDKNSLELAANGSLEWARFPFDSPVRRIMASPLPNLPKRTYLSPFGKPAQEFTMAFLIELNDEDMAIINGDDLVRPGFFFAGIGENWEFFLNGKPVYSEMHLDENGRIKKHRTWRDVHFPADSSHFILGTNILTLRIVGDPTFTATGPFYNTAPVYMDDYRIIEKRQHNFLLLILCGFCIFAGIYYLLLFFSIKSRKEIYYYLFFGIFSILLCIYAITRNGMVNYFIPNSFFSIRLEYFSLTLIVPVFGMFIETLLKGRITKISRLYMAFCSFLALTQFIFCEQYGEEVIKIWDVTVMFYLSYIIFYDIIYFLFWAESGKKRMHLDMSTGSILIGVAISYFCGIFDVIDALFIRSGFNLFQHSVFVVHIGMAYALSQRFGVMYKELEQSNVILEMTVKERTLELIEQTEIAVAASRSKSEFLATMSHEIKTPLTVISVHVQQAARLFSAWAEPNAANGGEKETIASSLHRAQQEIMRVSGITENALRLASMEEGHKQMKVMYLDTLLINSAEAYRAILEKRGNKLNLAIADGMERVYGNADQFIQVMVNLLSNANRHTNDGTITVNAGPDGGSVKVTVTDNGSGIAPELMPHVFERGISGTGGTGFGLEICKKIIESHGGTISADSELGKGTVIAFALPVHREEKIK